MDNPIEVLFRPFWLLRYLPFCYHKTRQDGDKGFLFKPLNPDRKEVRLLCVLAGRHEDPIICTLHQAGLNDHRPPRYETISYCWGDADDQATIEINELILSVPTSSAAAIRRVRLPNDSRMVWIDAVCINQEDRVERAQQVSLMGDIYSSSIGNLVYLGEGDETTVLALHSIDSIMCEIIQETFDFQLKEGTPFDIYDPYVHTSAALTCAVDIAALSTFFNLPWFR